MTFFPRTLNLRQRLTLLLLVASVPGMAVAVVLAVNALAVQNQQIEQMATHLAALQAAQHTTVTESARIMLDTLIRSDAIAQADEVECGAFLSDWIERYPSFTALALTDASGEVLCSSMEPDLPFNPAAGAWFAQLKSEKEFTVGQYAVGREGTPMVMAGQPVLDSQGAFKGAVAVGIGFNSSPGGSTCRRAPRSPRSGATVRCWSTMSRPPKRRRPTRQATRCRRKRCAWRWRSGGPARSAA